MNRNIRKFFSSKSSGSEIAPDEIFLDSSNLPQFDNSQFEGRLEKPISRKTVISLGLAFLFIGIVFSSRIWMLQVTHGEEYSQRSENNTLRDSLIFSKRGTLSDRNGVPLAWNEPLASSTDFLARKYISEAGFSHVLGYVKYPKQDSSGAYYSTSYVPDGGVEADLDPRLSGQNGKKIVEVDALGKVQSESVIEEPKDGDNIKLTIDARIQTELYKLIQKTAQDHGYSGGAGIIMDAKTGQVVAMTSYPEFDSGTMAQGSDVLSISGYAKDPNNPFLDRAVDGLYTPGSVVKPVMALGVLDTKTISPDKQILSTGSISIPNPYNPKVKNVFKDWRPNGWMDIRRAIAVSSDVYFYEVGGGYQDQKGMGIGNIDKYARLFGYGSPVPGDPLFTSKKGTVPSPEWKAANFDGEAWNIGDTYHTVIGQYGWQVTPIQVARAISAVANDGFLLDPQIVDTDSAVRQGTQIPLDKSYFDIVHQGMREGVLEGTSVGLNVPYVEVAGKTGTAELGAKKLSINSWAVGFFPYQDPHYVYTVIMEKGPITNTIGGVYVMRQLLDWMNANAPEYFK